MCVYIMCVWRVGEGRGEGERWGEGEEGEGGEGRGSGGGGGGGEGNVAHTEIVLCLGVNLAVPMTSAASAC